MKRFFNIAYIILFFVICATPVALWGFFENKEPIGKTELAEIPSITKEDGSLNNDFFDDFDDYFTDHLPFRTQLVTFDNAAKSQFLNAEVSNVITGKNGYIFSSETIKDYVGETFSNRKINNIARTVKIMEDKTKSTGNNFVFTVAPNKNSVYPEYMPDRYIKGNKSNLSLLTDKLEELDVNYSDLQSALSSYDQQLYLKRDTHWNNLGALYGFTTIMNSLGKEYKDCNGLIYTYEKNWSGDLDKMLYPSGISFDNQYNFNYNYDDINVIIPQLGTSTADTFSDLMGDSEKNDKLIKTRNIKASGQLLMVRDSFGRAMLPLLTDNYRSTTITRSQPFNMTSLTPNSNTDVIYEIVERNLGNIVSSAPLMEAVRCNAPNDYEVSKSNNDIIKIDTTDSYIKIYGEIDSSRFDDDSRILITLTSNNDSFTYEAFPIFEKELLNCDYDSDYGFSLTLSNDIPSGEYKISATIISENGSNINTDTLTTFNK